MRCILIFLLFVVSCKGEPISNHKTSNENISQKENGIGDTINISMGNLKLVLYGLPKDDFTYEIKKDTLYLIKKGDIGIDNLQLQILSGINTKELTGEIDYGAYQYLLDDMMPSRLNFTHRESVQIPMVLEKYDLSKVIKGLEELQNLYQKEYFGQLRKESHRFQKTFYIKEVLDKKEEYQDCCPEYIQKAKDFQLKKEDDFKTLSDLVIEPTYNKVILNLGNKKFLVFNNYLDNIWD